MAEQKKGRKNTKGTGSFRKKLSNMRLSKRLMSGFVSIAVVTGILGGLGILNIAVMRNNMNEMEQRMNELPQISEAIASLSSMEASASSAVLNYNVTSIYNTDKTNYQKYNQHFKTDISNILKNVQNSQWKSKLEAAQKKYNGTFATTTAAVFENIDNDNIIDANVRLHVSITSESEISETLENYMTYMVNMTKSENAAAGSRATLLLCISIIFSAAAIAAAVFMGFDISKSISKPVGELEYCAKRFSVGDMGAEITFKSGNELGVLAGSLEKAFETLRGLVQSISQILGNIAAGDLSDTNVPEYQNDFAPISVALGDIIFALNETFSMMKTSADQVDSGAKQVSDGAQTLARGSTEQASSTEELSASVTDISNKINSNADSLSKISSALDSATRDVYESNTSMKDTLAAMENISASSSEIGKIIKVIDNIAFQTNILALNAAVEAARAGEAGKGFAVVADEVRNLAGKSADAAKQTTMLIGKSISSVTSGCKTAEATAKSLEGVYNKIKGINETLGDIEKSSAEQAESVNQINISVEQISSIVQSNSATAEESAAASEELSAQAKSMKEQLEGIRLSNDAGGQAE